MALPNYRALAMAIKRQRMQGEKPKSPPRGTAKELTHRLVSWRSRAGVEYVRTVTVPKFTPSEDVPNGPSLRDRSTRGSGRQWRKARKAIQRFLKANR